jgi:hypothetical protein
MKNKIAKLVLPGKNVFIGGEKSKIVSFCNHEK